MSSEDFEKEFRLEREDAAEFLRDLADSLEDGENISMEGDGWKVFQPFENIIPLRVHSDSKGFEVGFKLIDSSGNQA